MKISSQMKLLALCLAYAVSVRRAAAMATRNTREIFQHTMAPVSLAQEDSPVSVDVPAGERNITIRWAGPTDTVDDADLQENVTADNSIASGCRQHLPTPLRYKINPGTLSLSHRERLQHLLQHNHFSHPDASPIVLLAADPDDDESDAEEDSFDTGNATEWKDTDVEETGEADEQGDEGADTSMALQVDSPVRQHLRSHRPHHPVVFLEIGSRGPVTVPTNTEIDLPKDTPTIGQRSEWAAQRGEGGGWRASGGCVCYVGCVLCQSGLARRLALLAPRPPVRPRRPLQPRWSRNPKANVSSKGHTQPDCACQCVCVCVCV